ncbi:MAG: hypothetical protein ACXVK3_19070, partial [Candidatus Angelobacter sp.]
MSVSMRMVPVSKIIDFSAGEKIAIALKMPPEGEETPRLPQSRAWTNLQALFNNFNKNAPALTGHCRHSQEYPTTVAQTARPAGAGAP